VLIAWTPCRYHKEEKAWFQRAEMPSESTSTYEKGDYVYFDPTQGVDTSWVLRFKKDFKVEYSMVEGDAWYEAYSVMTKS
jgi:CCR4-NOT transcriptional regulation complex NOT5 subunit